MIASNQFVNMQISFNTTRIATDCVIGWKYKTIDRISIKKQIQPAIIKTDLAFLAVHAVDLTF